MTNNVRAALLVILGMVLISSNDAIMKLQSEELGVGQLLFVRGLLAVAIFTVLIKASRKSLNPKGYLTRWTLFRAVLESAATLCFIKGLSLLPIATTSTLAWTAPIFITIAAALILGERVSMARWFAVLLGFSGVLLVTNPFAEEVSSAMWLPLAAAVFVCFRDIVTRQLDPKLHSMHVTFVTLVVTTLVGGLVAVFDWRPVDISQIAWLALSALLLGMGFLSQVSAMRKGELSFIVPFSYTGILMSVVYGYLIWDEFPTLMMFGGIVLIVAAGAYILSSSPRSES